MNANRRNRNRYSIWTSAVVLIAVVVLFALSFWVFPCAGVAEAVSPKSYVEKVEDKDFDWYMQSKYMNLSRLKEIVTAWFLNERYDFTEVESDPVVIAVIDTGIDYRHELFTGKYDSSGMPVESDKGQYDVFARDADGNIIGKNTVLKEHKDYTNKDQLMDDAPDKHGTHVSGIIATLIHELNLEKYIKILPIKAGYPKDRSSIISIEALRQGVEFAVDCGADVVNMSISSYDPEYGATCINEERANKAVFVAAAGNDKHNSSYKKSYPAAHSFVLGVMNYSYDANGEVQMSSSSNYGDAYDVCAPGYAIYSAKGGTTDDYKVLSGTSMAAPFVSFASALATMRYRALGSKKINQMDIANIVRNATTSAIYKSNAKCNVLDMCHLAESDAVANVEISVLSGDVVQTVGNVGAISMEAYVYPREDVGAVAWYVDDKFMVESKTFQYTPEDSVGIKIIKAVWSYGKDDTHIERTTTLNVSVVYRTLTVDTIKALNVAINLDDKADTDGAKYRVGATLHLGFENMPSYTIDPDTKVVWFVNEEFYAIGKEFDFVPEQIGTYKIQAKINGIYTNPIEITVDRISQKQLGVLRDLTIGLVSSIAFVIILAVVIMTVRKRRTSK